MAPGDWHALLVEAGADPVVIVRTVHVVLDVLLAAPHDFDWLFRLLGDQRRLHDEIEFEPAPKAAPRR